MKRLLKGMALFVVATTASCAFLLDTDELQQGTGGPAGAGAEPIPLEQAPAALAAAMCSAVQRCMGPATAVIFFDTDCTTTLTRQLQDSIFAGLDQSIAAGRVAYHPELAPACIAGYETVSCAALDLSSEACDQTLEGLVPAGGQCARSPECAAGTFCDTAQCPGTCKPRAGEGGPCLSDGMCENGLKCWQGTCRRPPSINQSCGGTEPDCEMGTLCLGQDEDNGTPGRCVSVQDLFVSKEGIGCSFRTGPLCEEGLHCKVGVSGVGTCVGPSPTGADCSLAVPDPCIDGEYCNLEGGLSGQCTAVPGANQECARGLVLKPPCRPEQQCVDGICKPMARLNQPCEGHAQCYSGLCSGGTCQVANQCP